VPETVQESDADRDEVATDAEEQPTDAVAEDGDRGPSGEDLLVREGDIAGDYLERLLDLVDYDGDIDLDV